MNINQALSERSGIAYRLMATLMRFGERVAKVLIGCAALAVLVSIAVIVADVIGRNILGKTLPWSGEFLTYLMIWTVFIGMVGITSQDSHIRVDIIDRALNQKQNNVREIIICVGVIALAIYLVPYSLNFVEVMHNSGKVSIDIGFPMWIVHSAVVVGFALSAFIVLIRLVALVLLTFDGKDEAK